MPELVTTNPPTAADLADEAEAAVRAFCGWHVAPSRPNDVARLRTWGGSVIILPSLHVTDVASVVVDGTPATGFTWTPNGVVYAAEGGCFAAGTAVVTFTHGYAADAPEVADVRRVIRRVMGRGGTSGGYVQVGQVRVATDAGGAPLGSSLTDTDKTDLAPYVLPPRP